VEFGGPVPIWTAYGSCTPCTTFSKSAVKSSSLDPFPACVLVSLEGLVKEFCVVDVGVGWFALAKDEFEVVGTGDPWGTVELFEVEFIAEVDGIDEFVDPLGKVVPFAVVLPIAILVTFVRGESVLLLAIIALLTLFPLEFPIMLPTVLEALPESKVVFCVCWGSFVVIWADGFDPALVVSNSEPEFDGAAGKSPAKNAFIK
jgi:hypothetical protein